MAALADFLEGRGRRREALEWYRRSLAQDPGNEWAALRAALIEGAGRGEARLEAIRGDRTLARFAAAVRREWALGRRAGEP